MEAPNSWCFVKQYRFIADLLEAVEAPVPSSIQGHSFLSLLDGGIYKPRKEIFAEKTWHDSYDPIRCIRTKRYKFIHNFEPRPRLILPIDIESSLTRLYMGDKHLEPRPTFELYDLEEDPYELNNLAKDQEYRMESKDMEKKTIWTYEKQVTHF